MGDIEKEISNINPEKATSSNSIALNISKKSSKVSASILHKPFNDSTEKSKFPLNLKQADTAAVYKKNDPVDETHHWTINVLPVAYKIYETIRRK